MKRLLLGLAIPAYVLDQATKAAILAWVPPGAEIPVFPGFFNIVHVHNTGAAFGMLQGANAFFTILSLAAFLVLAFLIRRGAFQDRLTRIGVALLLAGIAGNLTDRLLHGKVIDFLDFLLPLYGRWPAFNVADSCICIAAGLFFLSALPGKKRSAPEGQSR